MRIKIFKEKENNARYQFDQYTSEYGTIIFDGSKGGSVSNAYFLRIESELSTKNGFIDLYINKDSLSIQSIDLVSVNNFKKKLVKDLEVKNAEIFFTPIIDISTWVNPLGAMRGMSYDDTNYSNISLKINVIVEHNNTDVVRLVFGEIIKEFLFNENTSFHVDKMNNITAITFKSKEYVPLLLKKMEII